MFIFLALYLISLEFYLIVDPAETKPQPFLEVASRQLEAIQSQIKDPEAEAETEDLLNDSDEIPPISQAPSLKVASRQLETIQSQIKVPDAEAETEDNPSDSDGIPPISHAPPPFPHRSRAARQRVIVGDNSRSKTLRPGYISAKRKGRRRRREDTLNPGFSYFLYFLAFCALIFFLFLIFLFLLPVIFLYCLYVLPLSYN